MNEHLKKLGSYVLDRLQEKTTWHGVVAVLSAIFVGLKPDQAEAIITVGATVSGLILVATKD